MEALTGLAREMVQAGVTACALLLAFGVALGGVEGQLGALLGDPSLGQSAKGRIVILVAALALAAAAIPLGNAVANALL